MSTKINVVGAVLDTRKLVMYLVDGSTFTMNQGDPRLQGVVDYIMPQIRNGNVPVEVEIVEPENVYNTYEKNSSGLVRFFRVAKKTLANLFGKKEQPETVEPFDMIGEQKLAVEEKSALDEIMANAVPASSTSFKDVVEDLEAYDVHQNKECTEGDTIIAVVDGKTVVPDAQHIKHQLSHANATGSHQGIENFYNRIAKVADKRYHSGKDAMKFSQKGDLPIANDGSLIVYKSLNQRGDDFYDIHSGKVPQNVGTRVFMDESLVDPNRSNECSNGLHIARRDYVGTFSGNALFLCKVAPEDIIAVPQYDAKKMRVCGYDVIYRLNKQDEQDIRGNRPMSSEEGQKALASVISGNHPAPTRFVKIGGQRGTNLTITFVNSTVVKELDITEAAVAPLEAGSVDSIGAPAVNVMDVAMSNAAEIQETTEVVEEAGNEEEVTEQPKTRKEKVAALFAAYSNTEPGSIEETEAAKDIYALKSEYKVSWEKLGIEEPYLSDIVALAGGTVKTEVVVNAKVKTNGTTEVNVKSVGGKDLRSPEAMDAVKVVMEAAQNVAKAVSNGPKAKVAELLPKALKGDQVAIADIFRIKKSAKKGWLILGVSDKDLDTITKKRNPEVN